MCILWISVTGDAVTAESYFSTRENIASHSLQSPGLLWLGAIILHHNVRPRTATVACDWLWNYGWELVDHSTYSSNMIPNDFHPFGPRSTWLANSFNRCWYEANFRILATSIGPTGWQMLSVWCGPSCGVCYLIFLERLCRYICRYPGEFLSRGCCENELRPDHLNSCNSGRGVTYVKSVCNTS